MTIKPRRPKPDHARGGGQAWRRRRRRRPKSQVRLDNVDRRSLVRLRSNKGTSVQIWGDPHVRTKVDGRVRNFDIGYGPGQVKLKDGTSIRWNTYENQSKALLWLKVDAPGTKHDYKVRTNDGKDVTGKKVSLTDRQLREFISALGEYKADWNSPHGVKQGDR